MIKWRLLRCIYDPMGMNIIEVENPQRFKRFVDDGKYGEIGYFIGTLKEYDGKPLVKVELEGDKEQLEIILELIRQYVGYTI